MKLLLSRQWRVKSTFEYETQYILKNRHFEEVLVKIYSVFILHANNSSMNRCLLSISLCNIGRAGCIRIMEEIKERREYIVEVY